MRRAAGVFLALAAPAFAQDRAPLAGDYVCVYGCRPTDVNPSIAIVGDRADCMNELGGMFHGLVLSPTMLACFKKTGTLAPDGVTLTWSDGVIWRRHVDSAQ